MQWYSGIKKIAMSVSFFKNGISISNSAKTVLGSPKEIILGIDTDKKEIAIKAYANEKNLTSYNSNANRILCGAFVNFAEKELGKALTGKRFPAAFEDGIIHIDVSGTGMEVKRETKEDK